MTKDQLRMNRIIQANPKTWRELEAEGVKRCCVMFNDGTQCKRRQAPLSSWCAKHTPIMNRIIQADKEMLKRTAGGNK